MTTPPMIDSRAWTGDIPDYRAMMRRALGLDCQPHQFYIALHVMSSVTPEMRAEIEQLCATISNIKDNPDD